MKVRIKRQDDLRDYIVHSPYENLDLIPSSTLLASFSFQRRGKNYSSRDSREVK